MLRHIVSFRQRLDGHWCADLECGHRQVLAVVRGAFGKHWVETPEGRQGHLGMRMECDTCRR